MTVSCISTTVDANKLHLVFNTGIFEFCQVIGMMQQDYGCDSNLLEAMEF